MANFGDFYGFSIEVDNTLSLFRGFSVEFRENLILRFFDSFGDPIDNLDELQINDGTSTTTLNKLGGGSYSLFVKNLTTFIIIAIDDGKQGIVNFVHQGEDETKVIDIFLLTPPCIDQRTSNIYNFYHWHQVNNIFLADLNKANLTSFCNRGFEDFLPNVFHEQDENCWNPLIVEGEEISIQINFEDRITIDTDNLVIAMLKDYAIVWDAFTPVQVYEAPEGGKLLYITYTFPKGLFAGKDFQFILYDQSDGSVRYISNQFDIESEDSDYALRSVYVDYKNSSNLDDFEYENLSNFSNKVRIQLNNIDYDYEYELQTYREQSTGIRRRQKSQKSKFVRLEAYLFDQYAHDAMASLSDHDEVYINGERVDLKTGFSTSIQRDMKVHKGSVEWYVRKYSTVNLKG